MIMSFPSNCKMTEQASACTWEFKLFIGEVTTMGWTPQWWDHQYMVSRIIMSRHLVFVYGTLKRNEPNHHWLTEKENGDARLVGVANMTEKYPLVIASRYNIPYTLAAPGKGENIEGEVYDVDDKMLSKLDILEDHPKYYERKIKKAILQDTKEEIDCWIYLLHQYKPHMLELPFLKAYLSKGDHGKEYVASEDDISDPDDI